MIEIPILGLLERDRFDNWLRSKPISVPVLGKTAIVTRRAYGDKGVYISLECNCDWEIEHGLQIVFKNGRYINKIGPYDGGHLTNSDAFADDSLENVVYKSF